MQRLQNINKNAVSVAQNVQKGGGAESGVGGTMEFVFDFIKVDLNNFLNAFAGDAQNSPLPLCFSFSRFLSSLLSLILPVSLLLFGFRL